MKYTRLLIPILMSSFQAFTMDESTTTLNQKQNLSQNNLFKAGAGLIAFQAGAFTWRAIEEINWIIYQADAVTIWETNPKKLEEQIPLRLKNLRTTNKIGSALLVGFAYEAYLYQRYFKDLKSE